MPAPHVDTRKLKDSVAEYLRKSKFDKAAELLEQLVRAEPKDMQHRLKLGDAYRRMDKPDKAVACYEYAGKVFGDEGQLIKAIGAVKIILEIDPKNEAAQRQLAEMNDRRFAKPTLESAGLRTGKIGVGAGARATSPIELDEAQDAASAAADALVGSTPLELDQSPKRPPRTQPPPTVRPKIDLGGAEFDPGHVGGAGISEEPLELARPGRHQPGVSGTGAAQAPPGRTEFELDLDSSGTHHIPIEHGAPPAAKTKAAAPESLPDDAILIEAAPAVAKGPPAAPPRAPPPPSPPPAPAPTRAATPAKPAEAEEIELDLSGPTTEPIAAARPPPAPAAAAQPKAPPPEPQPIADLLSSEAEEEIELLSVSSEEEPEPASSKAGSPSASEEDIDQAFGQISPAAQAKPKHKIPARVPLFDDLPKEAFVELINKLEYHRYHAPQLILREGEPGRSFFVIVEGQVRVFKNVPGKPELTLARLSEGAFFGEMALLSGAPRTANVAAEDDVEVLEISDQALRGVVEKFPHVAKVLKNFYRQRLLNNVMAISPMFKDFDKAERKQIVEKFRLRTASANEVLITQGQPSDGLYVVLHGTVRVTGNAKGGEVELARLKEGELFGEISLLTRKAAVATVTAVGNAILLKLPRDQFQELVLTHPQILELVSQLSDERRSATEAILQGQGPGIDGMSFV